MAYIPPSGSLLFNFTNDGYTPPDFDKLLVSFGSTLAISDLKTQINCIELQRDYLKSCETYVVGYAASNLQILKHSCTYGGIRDLSAFIDIDFMLAELPTYIKANFFGVEDLTSLLKGFDKGSFDLSSRLHGWYREAQSDLPTYLKQGHTSSTDFFSYIKTFIPSSTNITSLIKGWVREESEILPSLIKGWSSAQLALPYYLKPTFPAIADLTLDVFKIWQHSEVVFSFALYGWAVLDLGNYIHAISYLNLPTVIRATYLYDLAASMLAIPPVDLEYSLYGWATHDMSASIAFARSPNDLECLINPINSVDLAVKLKSFLELESQYNLNFDIQSYYIENLSGFLTSVAPVDLGATLFPKSTTVNLNVSIVPKVVYVRSTLILSFLECADLQATINTLCFGSSYRNLAMSLQVVYSTNLKATVFGYDSSNIVDLAVLINNNYYCEEDKLALKIFKAPLMYTKTVLKYTTYDGIVESDILSLNLNRADSMYAELSASIGGDYLKADLGAFIRPYTNLSYEFSSVKQKVVSLKLNHANVEEWRRYVEIIFDKYVRSYYYFSGNQKVYNEFEDDSWVVEVRGYSLFNLPEGLERCKVNRKYIFNLKSYSSVDAAIKDMIDRVSIMRDLDLSCAIEGVPKKEADLSVSIASRSVYKSNRVLPVSITSV